jgi:Domain of Unknown Function (DUF1907)
MARLMEMEKKSGFVLSASASPFHVVRMNSELMPNLSYRGEEVTNLTHYAEIDKKGGCVCKEISSGDCGLMANLFGTDGSPEKVIKVVARIRAGGWTSLRLCKRHCGRVRRADGQFGRNFCHQDGQGETPRYAESQ